MPFSKLAPLDQSMLAGLMRLAGDAAHRGNDAAASHLAAVCATALDGAPEPHLPWHHYGNRITQAIELMYGPLRSLSDQSNRVQLEAVEVHGWLRRMYREFGYSVDWNTEGSPVDVMGGAIARMNVGGEGWRREVLDLLRESRNTYPTP